ncbi:MAG: hypothetical protein JWM80_5236 [Cyanobacteria bacterium RYN_339]|nr:hypothetical protein [Cyanobacteria bacterium RYN_339]
MPDWGGPRPGAGRKPKQPGKSRVTLSTRISEDSARILKAYAERTGKSQGEVLDDMVTFVQSQPGFEGAHGPVSSPAEPDAYVRGLIDQMPGAVAFVDARMALRLANDEFRLLMGNEAVGRSCHDALASCIEGIEPVMESVLAGGPAQRMICCGLGSYGDRCFEVRLMPFGQGTDRGLLLAMAIVPVPVVGQNAP